MGVEEELLPHHHALEEESRRGSEEPIDEERRLFYVGMTRARRRLYLCHAHDRLMWGRWRGACRSRFVDEIPEGLRAELDVAGAKVAFSDAEATRLHRGESGVR